MLSLLLATRNAHKTREFSSILGANFAVTDLTTDVNMPPIDETGATFEENAILKAVTVSRLFPGLVVADDSGLEVASLAGAPGVYSARYAGDHARDHENVAKLLRELNRANVRNPSRDARFCCALALAEAGRIVAAFDGEIRGAITDTRRGNDGFGYDPVFIPEGFDQTFAEVGDAVKNRISHRAMAIKKLRDYLTLEPKSSADPR